MEILELYPGQHWIEASYIRRDNRFVMTLNHRGKEIKAHVPNTGRMEEFRYPGAPFFLVPSPGKYPYKVVSTEYDGQIILIDSIKSNWIVQKLIQAGRFPQFQRIKEMKREVSVGQSKFDFSIQQGQTRHLIEIKSCTLQFNGSLMFPDAPTERGRRHLTDLETIALAQADTRSHLFYLTTHVKTKRFFPNLHTDLAYATIFAALKKVDRRTYRLKMTAPDRLDLDSLAEIPVDYQILEQHLSDRGIYILVLENPEEVTLKIGSLGGRVFKKGFYFYIGSGKANLGKRIERHQRKRKKRHWHLDYILPGIMKLVKAYPIRSQLHTEFQLSEAISASYPERVPGFGASDSPAKSHLFYSSQNPIFTKVFQDLLLDFRSLAL